MRGVSGGSLAAVLDAVEGSTGTLSTVGDELFLVAAMLDATPSIRRVLTDPATEPDARCGLAAAVLSDKVDVATLGISTSPPSTAGRRVATSATPSSSPDSPHTSLPQTRTAPSTRWRMSCSRGSASSTSRTSCAVSSPTDPSPRSTRARCSTRSSARRSPRPRSRCSSRPAATRTGSFDAVLARFADEVAARRQRVLAEVRSAYELGKAESKRLAEALSATYGQEVHLNVIVDPAIVGGLRVSIGDDVIDGTVAGRLEDARRQLAG